jgi:hypothetical protein
LRAARRAALLLALALATPAALGASPELDYMLNCQGCHLPDGSGLAGAVPSLHEVGRFLRTSRGREYLIRVPGSAQSPLDDAALAALLDWIVGRFDPDTAATGYRRFDAAEVARWRRPPLTEVDALRAELLAELSASDASAARAGRDRAGSGSPSPAPARR